MRPLGTHPLRLARWGLLALTLVVAVLLLWLWRRSPERPPVPAPGEGLRVATFNIRNYPESETQRGLALETLGTLGAPVVALQEITAPDVFDAELARVLGPDYATVYALLPRPPATDFPLQNLGFVYDTRRFVARSVRIHPLVGERGKPALELHLVPRGGGRALRLFNVHLKAYDEGLEMRRAQLRALTPVVAAAVRSGEPVMLLGDFNSTRPEDRAALEAFAAETGLVWGSRALACTEYWDPDDSGVCQASPLDHVFAWPAPSAVEALGPCRELACRTDLCPIFYREVSDHCPVVVDW